MKRYQTHVNYKFVQYGVSVVCIDANIDMAIGPIILQIAEDVCMSYFHRICKDGLNDDSLVHMKNH